MGEPEPASAAVGEATSGLVLSGGGADGAYSVGVCKALFNAKSAGSGFQALQPGVITGTSIGSFNAAYLVSKWDDLGTASIGALESVWLEHLAEKARGCGNGAYRVRLNPLEVLDPRCYLPNPLAPLRDASTDGASIVWDGLQRLVHFVGAGDEALLRRVVELVDFTSFISAEPWYKLLREVIDYDGIRRSSRAFRIPAVNWETGQLKIFKNVDMSETLGPLAVAASSALPGFYPPVKVGAQAFIDGGVLLNTPLSPAIAAGASELHVVYLDPPIENIALSDLGNTMETLYRMQQIGWANAVNADILNARRMNWVIESLVRSGAYEKFPEVIAEFRRRYGGRRIVTIHRYFPKEDFGGALGLLNLERGRLERLIARGFNDGVEHNCADSDCVLPGVGVEEGASPTAAVGI